MRVEEIIGMRMRQRREKLERTQDLLGQEIGQLLEKPWSRQAVSAAEQGKRAFTAVELFAIANCLQTTLISLFRPPAEVSEIDMPSGEKVPTSTFIGLVSSARGPKSVAATEEFHMVKELGEALDGTEESLGRANAVATRLVEYFMRKGDVGE